MNEIIFKSDKMTVIKLENVKMAAFEEKNSDVEKLLIKV
jgi:hypothetical protein